MIKSKIRLEFFVGVKAKVCFSCIPPLPSSSAPPQAFKPHFTAFFESLRHGTIIFAPIERKRKKTGFLGFKREINKQEVMSFARNQRKSKKKQAFKG